MSGDSLVSVVIPTYNRSDKIINGLESLACQDFSAGQFEVVVIDDGSSMDYGAITQQPWRFSLHYVRQENKGGTAAKNYGASIARGEILFFLDDDISISPNFISEIYALHQNHPKSIIMGHLITMPVEPVTVFGTVRSRQITNTYPAETKIVEIEFVECLGGFFSVRKADFMELGQLQGVGDGWPNWEDLDFAYRAFRGGYKFLLCPQAKGYHYDYSMADRTTNTKRWEKAAQAAVLLFQKYPQLQQNVVTFKDKTPISIRNDSASLVIRKIGRSMTSKKPVVYLMEKTAGFLENHFPSPTLLIPLYRWINSSYIFRGYRKGLASLSGVGAGETR